MKLFMKYLLLLALLAITGFVALELVPPKFLSFKLFPNKITILGEDNPTMLAIEEVSADYVPKNDKIQLKFVSDPYEILIVKAQNDLAAGLGIHDLILDYNTALFNYTRNDYVYSIQDLKKVLIGSGRQKKDVDKAFNEVSESIYLNAWKETGWYSEKNNSRSRERPVGFPHTANTMFLAYNKKLFENNSNKVAFRNKYGYDLRPPNTWLEYSDIAAFFTPQDKSTYGVCMQGDEYWIYYEWANFIFSEGGAVFNKKYGWEGNENTPLLLSSFNTIKATEKWLEMKKYQSKNIDFFASNASEQLKCLLNKDVAMGIIWSDVAYDLVKNDLSKETKDHTFAFSPIPGKLSMLAGGTFYINKKSDNPGLVADYIIWLLQYETQKKLAIQGLCSPNKKIYEDKNVIKKIPYTIALKESLDRGVYMLEAGPDAEPIILILSSALQSLWRDGDLAKVKPALIKAEREIELKRKEIFDYINANKKNKT